jgi:trk system potassium uptake protein TrkH
MGNYASLPTFAKWVLTLDMLLGRLEIYTVIILLMPRFYKK